MTFTPFGGTIDLATVPNSGAGIQGIVSGWGAGDVIDFQAIGAGATLSLTTAGSNTVASVSSGGVTQTVTLAGQAPSQLIQLVSDGGTGEELAYLTPPVIVVSSGVTSTGLNVYAGSAVVSSGGTLSAAGVYSGASATIQTGGVDQNSTIYAGGFETELGSATGDLIYGTQLVSAATAIVTNETVYTGGAVDLFLAGANGTGIVDSGGQINISGRATLTNATLSAGSLVLESPKATVSGTLTFAGNATLVETVTLSSVSGGIYFGDEAEIVGFAGGDAIDLASTTQAALAGNAALTLATGTLSGAAYTGSPISGATVTSATITFTPSSSGAPSSEVFTFAGTALSSDLVLLSDGSGGVELVVGNVVSNGNTSNGTTVDSGTFLLVSSGGTASGATVSSGGTEDVMSGGIDQGSTIQMGGTASVFGSASGDSIYGSQTVGSGGMVSGETVYAGGSINLTSGTGTGLVVSSGGSVNLGSGSTLSNTTLNTGTITVSDPTAMLTGTLSMDPGNTIVVMSDQPGGYQDLAVISGFLPVDAIDLTSTTDVGSGYNASPSQAALSFTTSGGNTVASITEGATTDSFIFAGTLIGSSLYLASDGAGGVDLLTTACYAEGTLIRTPDGETAVEALSPGDPILTASGAARPVKWIGFRHLDLTRHPAPERAQPIRIKAGAIADGVPARDLRLSPDHAVLLDGMLIPARLLRNDTTIVREAACRSVTYYHVELDSHDVLLAEGMAAESYLDTGNRTMFANAGPQIELFPAFDNDQARREAESCAPFAAEPDRVRPVWTAIAERARLFGLTAPDMPVSHDPDLCIVAAGRRIAPSARKDGRYWFALADASVPARLMSRAAVPHEMHPWVEDSRLLGVRVARLEAMAGETQVSIALDDPILAEGWWAAEADAGRIARWTDGNAALPPMGSGPVVVYVEIEGELSYPMALPRMEAKAARAGRSGQKPPATGKLHRNRGAYRDDHHRFTDPRLRGQYPKAAMGERAELARSRHG